jgi:hypothetical protein
MSGNKQGMGKRKEPEATFDFTKVGRGFMREWGASVDRATRALKVLAGLQPQGNSRADLEEFEELCDEYKKKLDDEADKQSLMICQILKGVPKSWLIAGAPEHIDWSLDESLDYIQADRYAQLAGMVGSGKHYLVSAEAKN